MRSFQFITFAALTVMAAALQEADRSTDVCGPEGKCTRVTCVPSGAPGIGHCQDNPYCPQGQCPIDGSCVDCPKKARRLQGGSSGVCSAADAPQLSSAVADPQCNVVTLGTGEYKINGEIEVTRPVTIVGSEQTLKNLASLTVTGDASKLQFIKDTRSN